MTNSRVPSGNRGASFFESFPTPGWERTSNRSDTVTAMESGVNPRRVDAVGEAVGGAQIDGSAVAVTRDGLAGANGAADADGLDGTATGAQPSTKATMTVARKSRATFRFSMNGPIDVEPRMV